MKVKPFLIIIIKIKWGFEQILKTKNVGRLILN